MILISHRGNIDGKVINLENHPDYVDKAISLGYDVEIDLRFFKNNFYLGHDECDYKINLKWLEKRKNKLWIHCKDTSSVIELFNFNKKENLLFNFFFHDKDKITLTSKNYIWVYPGNQPIKNSIAVLPELYDDNISHCYGICSDFIKNYK